MTLVITVDDTAGSKPAGAERTMVIMNSAISLRQVTKQFGALTAVDRLDLDIDHGSVVALLGPNGAGKTTTTDMMLGITQPTSGELLVHGSGPVAAMRAGLVGAMLQNGRLLENTRVDLMLRLMHGLHRRPLPLGEVIEAADITDVLKTNTNQLSGGQAQRVRFALALMADPRLMLLDEPTVAMDVQTRRRFWRRIRHFANDGRTIVFATHFLDEADEFADRVIMLNRGRIVADGTGADIRGQLGGRVISFVSAEPYDWESLDGVVSVTRDGTRIALNCADSDLLLPTLAGMIHTSPGIHDLEIASPRLEDAFVQITAESAA